MRDLPFLDDAGRMGMMANAPALAAVLLLLLACVVVLFPGGGREWLREERTRSGVRFLVRQNRHQPLKRVPVYPALMLVGVGLIALVVLNLDPEGSVSSEPRVGTLTIVGLLAGFVFIAVFGMTTLACLLVAIPMVLFRKPRVEFTVGGNGITLQKKAKAKYPKRLTLISCRNRASWITGGTRARSVLR